jgi:hypothetical protein
VTIPIDGRWTGGVDLGECCRIGQRRSLRAGFTGADGKQAANARIYFKRSGASSVVANVGFVNK